MPSRPSSAVFRHAGSSARKRFVATRRGTEASIGVSSGLRRAWPPTAGPHPDLRDLPQRLPPARSAEQPAQLGTPHPRGVGAVERGQKLRRWHPLQAARGRRRHPACRR